MAAKDTLIMGSDGLFDNLTTDEIIDIIRAGHLDRQAELLVRRTGERMLTPEVLPSKPDDLTVIGFRQ
jgi:protein phosphatase